MMRPSLPFLFMIGLAALASAASAPTFAASEAEPNDDSQHATALPLDTEMNASTGVDDMDWYTISVPEAGLLVVRATGASLTAYFYAANSTPLYDYPEDRGNSTVDYPLPFEELAAVYLRVSASGPANYSLRASFTAGFGGTQGPTETEPNGDAAHATPAPLNAPLEGRLDASYLDLDVWSVSIPSAGLVTITLTDCCNTGLVQGQIYPLDLVIVPVETGVRIFPGALARCFACGSVEGLYLYEPANFTFTVTFYWGQYGASPLNYTLRVDFTTDFSATEGAGEIEPNNGYSNATPIGVGDNRSGRLNPLYLDIDFWKFTPATSGWAAIELTPFDSGHLPDVRDGEGLEPPYGFLAGLGGPLVVSVEVGRTYTILVGSASGNYTLHVWVEEYSSVFFAGAGEAEPNDSPAMAQTLNGSGVYEGKLGGREDSYDNFRVSLHAGDFIDLGLIDSSWAQQIYFEVTTEPVSIIPYANFGGPWGAGSRHYFVERDGELRISARDEYYESTYTIRLDVWPTPYMADGVLTLEELQSDARFLFSIMQPSHSWSGPVFLEGAQGDLFGSAICLHHGLDGGLRPVTIGPDLLFEPETSGGRTFVSVDPGPREFFPGGDLCLSVLARRKEAIVQAPERVHLGANLTGDGVVLLETLSEKHSFGLAAQLALWAIESPPTQAEMVTWNVTHDTAVEANGLLEEAGLPQRLWVPAPPPPLPPPPVPGGGAPSPQVSTAFAAGVVLGIALVVAIPIVVVAAVLARSKGARSTARPPVLGPAGISNAVAVAGASPGHPRCPACNAPCTPGYATCLVCGARQ